MDPSLVEGLQHHELLHELEPESLIDKQAAEASATQLGDLLASGALDHLASWDAGPPPSCARDAPRPPTRRRRRHRRPSSRRASRQPTSSLCIGIYLQQPTEVDPDAREALRASREGDRSR
ncbi:hypothetical protein [Baekduia alba]|uniref:hypothetical protein n=1 Tax=Baekduia alba TaxID=2997333 RepID=UPI0023411CE6|nr:hypothetical protein [Baekduia alba]